MVTEPRFIIRRTTPWLGEWLVECLTTDGYGLWSEERADAIELGEVEAVAMVMRLEDYALRWDMRLSIEPAGLDPVTK